MWMDMLPSYEKNKRRKRMRSPEAYRESRDGIVGPEKAGEQMEHNSTLAELGLALEMEPKVQESLKKSVSEIFEEKGSAMFSGSGAANWEEIIKSGNFEVGIDTNPDTQEDQVALYPEGNVSEKAVLKKNVGETIASQVVSSGESINLVEYKVLIDNLFCCFLQIPSNANTVEVLDVVLENSEVQRSLHNKKVKSSNIEIGVYVNIVTN